MGVNGRAKAKPRYAMHNFVVHRRLNAMLRSRAAARQMKQYELLHEILCDALGMPELKGEAPAASKV